MYLLTSWAQSLSLFLPKNFKLFVLVTLRAIGIALKDFFCALWWVALLVVFLQVTLDVWLLSTVGEISFLAVWGCTIFFSLLLSLLLFLSVRPSVTLKNCSYYLRYSWYIIYCFLLLAGTIALSLLLQTILPYPLEEVFFYMLTLGDPFTSIFVVPLFFVSPFLIFCILFLLDSDGRPLSFIWSIIRGASMVIYNYPFCFLSFLFFFGFNILIVQGYYFSIIYVNMYQMPSMPVLIVTLLFNRCIFLLSYLVGGLIPLVFFTNFYIKRVHDQFGLYFKQS